MTPVLNDHVLLNKMESKADLGVFGMEVGSTNAHTGDTMLDEPTGDKFKDCWSTFNHEVNEEGTHCIWNWVRHHYRARSALFSPTQTGPNPEHVQQSRTTHVLNSNGWKLDNIRYSWSDVRERAIEIYHQSGQG